MWFVRAIKGNTKIEKLKVPEGKEAAERIKKQLTRYGWKEVQVFYHD